MPISERLKVNTAGRVERIVLICENISQLVADKLRSANLFVSIPVGVTVDPVLRPASLDEIILIGKGSLKLLYSRNYFHIDSIISSTSLCTRGS